jgi:tetratricopeptide (TPR) repeat protein
MTSKLCIGLLLSLLAMSCSSGQATGPGAQDPVRLAETEYDLARDLWLQRGQLRDALEHALKAVKLDEQNAEAQHLVALLYLDFCARSARDCRLPEAEQHARLALKLKPDLREARNTLGVILIHAKRPREAVSELRPLSEDILYQTPEKAWGNLGWAYLELGDLERSIDALRRSIAAQPLFCVGSYRLGLAYHRKGEPKAALDALTRALETEAPECSRLQDAFVARARVHRELGHSDAEKADLARCVELSGSTEAGKNCRSMLEKLK